MQATQEVANDMAGICHVITLRTLCALRCVRTAENRTLET